MPRAHVSTTVPPRRDAGQACPLQHVAAIHPGIVATGMTAGVGAPAADVAHDILKVIKGLNAERSGQFLNRHGLVLPW